MLRTRIDDIHIHIYIRTYIFIYVCVCASTGRVNEIIDGPTRDPPARKDDKRSLTNY